MYSSTVLKGQSHEQNRGNFLAYNLGEVVFYTFWNLKTRGCCGTGTDSTVPTNTVQVPRTTGTGTVMDSGMVYTGLLGAQSGYIYRTGKL